MFLLYKSVYIVQWTACDRYEPQLPESENVNAFYTFSVICIELGILSFCLFICLFVCRQDISQKTLHRFSKENQRPIQKMVENWLKISCKLQVEEIK